MLNLWLEKVTREYNRKSDTDREIENIKLHIVTDIKASCCLNIFPLDVATTTITEAASLNNKNKQKKINRL